MSYLGLCRPAPGLQQFVRFFTEREGRICGPALVHPVTARATPMIEFILGDPIHVISRTQGTVRESQRVAVVGSQTYRRLDLHLQGALKSFVIMFQPDGLYRLFSIPMSELTDQDFEGHAVLGAFISQLHERLGDCNSFQERVTVVNDLLLRRALTAPDYDGISAAANQILLSGGRAKISSLAGCAGLSIRQFERRFADRVGMRPKLYSRIARFEAALDGKARFTARSWTDVAHQFGYYDQMHMVHDFGEFTGETPTKTLAELETVFAERLLHVRSAGDSPGREDDPRVFF